MRDWSWRVFTWWRFWLTAAVSITVAYQLGAFAVPILAPMIARVVFIHFVVNAFRFHFPRHRRAWLLSWLKVPSPDAQRQWRARVAEETEAAEVQRQQQQQAAAPPPPSPLPPLPFMPHPTSLYPYSYHPPPPLPPVGWGFPPVYSS